MADPRCAGLPPIAVRYCRRSSCTHGRRLTWGAANPLVLTPETAATFLAPLPVATLDLPGDCERRLAQEGLHTLGAIAGLPRGSLGDYVGPAALSIEAVARGEDGRPLRAVRPPLIVEATRTLDDALTNFAQLDALLAELLCAPLAELDRRGLGATRVRLTLTPEHGKSRTIEIPLPAPTTEPRAILAQLRAALPRLVAQLAAGAGDSAGPGGVDGVALALVAPQPLVSRQLSIFDVPTGRRALLALGVGAAQRRGGAHLGHWEPVDTAHPFPEQRYAFVEEGPADDPPWSL